jgi:hypothetical protein
MPLFCDKICDTDLEAVEAIRSACHGLLPNWQRPEAFFIRRSNITSGLTKLLRLLGNEPRQLNGRMPRPALLPHQVRAAAALRLAETTLRLNVPATAPQEAQDGVGASGAPKALPATAARRRPAARRRHHYPMPPRGVNSQGSLKL